MDYRTIVTIIAMLTAKCLFAQTSVFPTVPLPLPGGGAGSLQYKNVTTPGGLSAVTSDGTNMFMSGTSTLPSTAAGAIELFAAAVGNYSLPAFVEPNGPAKYIQPNLIQHRSEFLPIGYGSTTTSAIATGTTVSGTVTATNFSTSNPPYTTARTVQYITSTSTNAIAGVKFSSGNFVFAGSSTTNGGGFKTTIRFAVPFSQNNSSAWVGMSSGTTIPAGGTTAANVTNFIGMGYAVSDANYSIIYNDASGTPNTISLGSNFPTGTSTQGYYELVLYNNVTMGGFGYRVTNLQTNAVASGQVTSSDIPSTAISVSPQALVTNLTSGQSVPITIGLINAEGY